MDDEEREQDRMAKHFAKRARRNRILEEYEGDSQFSRSRLIDEDVTMQMDLKTMKVNTPYSALILFLKSSQDVHVDHSFIPSYNRRLPSLESEPLKAAISTPKRTIARRRKPRVALRPRVQTSVPTSPRQASYRMQGACQ